MPERGKVMEPIQWAGGKLLIIDQTLLPGELRYVECADYAAVIAAIQKMQVRGAPAIGVAGAFGLVLAAQAIAAGACAQSLPECAAAIRAARPTAVNLAWAVDRLAALAATNAHLSPSELSCCLEQAAVDLLAEDIATNRRLGQHGQILIPGGARVLTHCNTGSLATAGYGTALGVIRAAVAAGKNIQVLAAETRPFLQGARLTAWELMQDGIPVTLITDSMAGYMMQQGRVDLVIVGADRIAANGDTANKIGTYSLAVLARAHSIPFYIAAPVSTLDLAIADGSGIPIEERDPREVTHIGGVRVAPDGVRVANPAFDVTPGGTDRGHHHRARGGPRAVPREFGGAFGVINKAAVPGCHFRQQDVTRMNRICSP